MSYWNPNNTFCINCEAMMILIYDVPNKYYDGECILWCLDCGMLLKANKYDPISLTNWRVPKMSELNIKQRNKYTGKIA